jgi:exopolyphosphatase/guanosine-5'-triphosphate,3'-diphosphate pyrophosphatase
MQEDRDMTEVRPRWEWRTFARSFGAADARLAELGPGAVQDSEEIYLLRGTGDNVKVRDALMDIKVLRQVNADGLEQWTPVMKQGFPLSQANVTRVLEALRLPVPPLSRPQYSLDDFIGAFAAPGSAIRAVTVRKRRVRHTVNGCMAEVSEVEADGRTTRTVAVESEDAVAVANAVRSLGLLGYTNTSYPKGLAALIDDAPARYAVIDVGTNSVKFYLAERDAGGRWRAVVDRAAMTRLGEGLDKSGVIGEQALARTATAIADMAEEARRNGAVAIVAVGTAGLRIAANREAVLGEIRARSGVVVEVISGEEEGRLAYVAARAGLGLTSGRLVVFDTGGGSSQFTFGHGSAVEERFSVDVGAVRYTERFGLDRAVPAETVRAAMAAISDDLSRISRRSAPDALVGMGGAVTNMTSVKHRLAAYAPDVVQGTVLDRAEVDRQIESYRALDADGRRAIVGLQPKRAEVILAGACIVRTIMETLGQETMVVSDRGLRHGVLVERFGD